MMLCCPNCDVEYDADKFIVTSCVVCGTEASTQCCIPDLEVCVDCQTALMEDERRKAKRCAAQ